MQLRSSLFLGLFALGAVACKEADGPQTPAPVPTFATITAGPAFTCATTPTGEAWCWGNNDNAQLGNGTTASSTRPVRVQGSLFFLTVDAGDAHTCGMADSGIHCWGSNWIGQLGVGDSATRTVPTRIAGARTYQDVSAGSAHSCAVDSASGAWCWGSNSSLQLAIGSGLEPPVPTRVVSARAFRRISAAMTHACAIANDESAWCWGWNQAGVLG